MPLFYTRS